MRGWLVDWFGMKAWFEAETRSKARYRAYLCLRDIGYDVRLTQIRVTSDRCPLRRRVM